MKKWDRVLNLRRIFEPTKIRTIPGGYEFSHRDLFRIATGPYFDFVKLNFLAAQKTKKVIEETLLSNCEK
jgi:hypothetical protein